MVVLGRVQRGVLNETHLEEETSFPMGRVMGCVHPRQSRLPLKESTLRDSDSEWH